MMKLTHFLTLVALGTMSLVCRAADPPQFPTPVKEHEWLKNLAGDWESDCEYCMEPGKPPVKTKATENARMLGGFWIISDGKSDILGMPFSSQFTLGYDPEKKRYTGTWIDSMTNYVWKYDGVVDPAGKVLTLTTEGPSPTDPTKHTKFKEVIELTGRDTKSFSSSYLDGAEWKTCAKMTSKRKSGAPAQATQAAQAAPGVNRPVHFEIPAKEPEKLAKFYTDVFGWQFIKAPIPGMEYWLCTTGSEGAGINGAILPRQNAEHNLTNYINVASVDATIEKATKAGAKVALAKMPVPGVGFVACLIDPQGNMCGLWEQEKK